jgi:excisionase family DNA binding protein
LADHFQVNRQTVRQWIRAGALPVLDPGGPRAGYRIRRADIDTFADARYDVEREAACRA